MTYKYGQYGYTDSASCIWTPYLDAPSNEPGWKARDAEVAGLHAQLAAVTGCEPTPANALALIDAVHEAIVAVRDAAPRVPNDADSYDIVDAVLPLLAATQSRWRNESLAALASKWEQSDDPALGQAAIRIRDELMTGLPPTTLTDVFTSAAGYTDAVLISEAHATTWTVLDDLDQPLEVRLAHALESANAREETLRQAAIPTEYEYRLSHLDADVIGNVRGPEEHAIGVWDSRRDTANESSYGADIKLQRRPLTEWEDFRVPTAADLGGMDTNR